MKLYTASSGWCAAIAGRVNVGLCEQTPSDVLSASTVLIIHGERDGVIAFRRRVRCVDFAPDVVTTRDPGEWVAVCTVILTKADHEVTGCVVIDEGRFTTGTEHRVRTRQIAAGALESVAEAIADAEKMFGLAADARVISCYEAGQERFWLHRYLPGRGATNHVVDSASIEVDRRARRSKTDAVDLRGLLALLARWEFVETARPHIEFRSRAHHAV